MRRATVILLAMIPLNASCARAYNEVEVKVFDDGVEKVEVELCSTREAMSRSGSTFRSSIPIDCEGSGKVTVTFIDNRQLVCPIGYVTTGATMKWTFVVQNRSCQDRSPKYAVGHDGKRA